MTDGQTHYVGDGCEPPHQDTTTGLFREPVCDHDDVGVDQHPGTTRTRCGLCGAELRWVVPVGGLIVPADIDGYYAMRMAVTVAKAQLDRGENPPINTTAAMVYWLDELILAADAALGEAGDE